MVKSSIAYLFTEQEGQYKTERWFEELQAQPELYANCTLVNFTRVKNLDSDYKHEYVQFIVEDTKTGDRARVYAERGNEEIVDYVTVGRTELGPKEWPELPLPLTSLIFDRGVRPSILRVAEILKAITTVGGGYKYYGNNCFWFAATAYRVMQGEFPATEKKWSWINSGGDGGFTLKGAYGLGFPTLFKFAFKPTASEFKTDRETHFNWLVPGNDRETVTPAQLADAIVTEFKEKAVMEEYLEAMRLNGVEVDQAEVDKVAASVQKSAAEKSKQADIKWTEEFDADVRDFSKKTLADPEAAVLEKLYKEKVLANAPKNDAGDTIIEVKDLYVGPLMDEYMEMEQAMDVFAGRVLMATNFSDKDWLDYAQKVNAELNGTG